MYITHNLKHAERQTDGDIDTENKQSFKPVILLIMYFYVIFNVGLFAYYKVSLLGSSSSSCDRILGWSASRLHSARSFLLHPLTPIVLTSSIHLLRGLPLSSFQWASIALISLYFFHHPSAEHVSIKSVFCSLCTSLYQLAR